MLDPYIVSILYKTESDEDTLKQYQDIMSKVMLLIEETLKYYFKQKNVSEDLTNQVLEAIDKDEMAKLSPEILAILKSDELSELLITNIDNFGKIIYDSLLPTLDSEDKVELNRYLEASEPIIKENAISILAAMLPQDENAAKTAEPAAPATDTVSSVAAPEVSSIPVAEMPQLTPDINVPVNLGGVNSTPAADNSQTTVAEPVDSETVPEKTTLTADPTTTDTAQTEATPEIKAEVSIKPDASATEEATATLPETDAIPVAAATEIPKEMNVSEATVVPENKDLPPFDWNSMVMDQLNDTPAAPVNPPAGGEASVKAAPVVSEQPITVLPEQSDAQPVTETNQPVPEVTAALATPIVTATSEQPNAVSKLDALGVLDAAPAAPAPVAS